MASNIRWSGIEQTKYGLTARWYCDGFYGSETDVLSRGLYNPTTNTNGWGSKEYPFKSLNNFHENGTNGSVLVLSSGEYERTASNRLANISIIGDGTIRLTGSSDLGQNVFLYNVSVVNHDFGYFSYVDCFCTYSNVGGNTGQVNRNSIFIECVLATRGNIENCTLFRCRGSVLSSSTVINSFILESTSLVINSEEVRPVGNIKDYTIIIGGVRSNRNVNGKTSGVTIEDFKVDGSYFVQSFSEVDLFGNASGSGATTAQIQTIFNNFISPVYPDTAYRLDLSLMESATDMVKFGGLNGTFIGALPVAVSNSNADLWAIRDVANTSNLELDVVSDEIRIIDGQTEGQFQSIEQTLTTPSRIEMVSLFANIVYNGDGTVSQGVANQRIDTTPDLAPDNDVDQRVVYDLEIAYSIDQNAVGNFLLFEIGKPLTVDSMGRSNGDEDFDSTTVTMPLITKYKVRFKPRKVIIM